MKTRSIATTAITKSGRDVAISAASATALVATLGLATVCWIVTVDRMRGMDMGVATRLGSFSFFLSIWVPMMAAMMLPGMAPVVLRFSQATRRALDVAPYVGTYLGVWALIGVLVFALYRPHGPVTAGVLIVGAGAYELTPAKRRFRQLCRDQARPGLVLGLCCVGSTIGLMVMMIAIGAMSVIWMAVTAGVVLVQKLLPPRAAVDGLVAMAIVSLGIAVLVAPSSVPGLLRPM